MSELPVQQRFDPRTGGSPSSVAACAYGLPMESNQKIADPVQAAEASQRAVSELSAAFMLDMETYVAAAGVGYEGISFYICGRGGVLGDVTAEDVAAAFVFFPHETVSSGWESGAAVEGRAESAQRFAETGHAWARAHLPEGALDYGRLAELAGKVIAAADGSAAPVFEGWRSLPEPTDERELVLHRMNALRELRAARHGAAVREVGLEPVDAFMVRTPFMASIFGWPEREEKPDEATKEQWRRAEDLTNEAFGRDLAVLDADELDEFCRLAEAVRAAAT